MIGKVEQRVDHDEPEPAWDRFTVTVEMPEKWNTLAAYRLLVGALDRMSVPDDAYIHVAWPQAWASWKRLG